MSDDNGTTVVTGHAPCGPDTIIDDGPFIGGVGGGTPTPIGGGGSGPGGRGPTPVPCLAGAGPLVPGQSRCAANKPQQQKCAAAKANLAAVDRQTHDLAKMNFKELGAGAGIGCAVGVLGGEVIETPLIGTPAAPGNCAVGAVGGALTAEGVFVIANFGDIVSDTVSEAEAVAQVVQACF